MNVILQELLQVHIYRMLCKETCRKSIPRLKGSDHHLRGKTQSSNPNPKKMSHLNIRDFFFFCQFLDVIRLLGKKQTYSIHNHNIFSLHFFVFFVIYLWCIYDDVIKLTDLVNDEMRLGFTTIFTICKKTFQILHVLWQMM